MAIPLVDVAWQHGQVRPEIDQAFDQILTNTNSDSSELVKALEADIAHYLGAGIHTVGVQSGRAAEFLILKALGIGPGDEVITVANSDIATTAAISQTGARFILVDVDADSHNLDPTQIETAITARTRAIVPVHMYGLPVQMEAIRVIAQRHKLCIIEDATLALGAEYQGAKVGTLGDAAFFSFAPRKVIGGTSNGGLVVTHDSKLAGQVRALKGYGKDPKRAEAPIAQRQLDAKIENIVEGYNLKLDDIQAAVIRAKLAHLEEWATLRQAVADRYTQQLTSVPGVSVPQVPKHSRHAWRNYVITIPDRDAVRSRLHEKGIATAVLYTPPVHLTPVYDQLGLGPGNFPVAEALAKKLLCLPMYPGMSNEQVDEVVSALAETLQEVG